jgi:hypothetical protein
VVKRRASVGSPAFEKKWKADQVGRMPRPWQADALAEHARRLGPVRSRSVRELVAMDGPTMAREFVAQQEDTARKRAGNLWLLDLGRRVKELGLCGLTLAAGDAEIVQAARDAAADLYELGITCKAADLPELVRLARGYAEGKGIVPPGCEDVPCMIRLLDPGWWRRQIRKTHAQAVECAAIDIGRVHADAEPFASRVSVERRRGQKRRNRAMLEATIATNQHGAEYTLAELSDVGIANPKIRRLELLCRVAGFERCAKEAGHEGWFITLTCPSRFHARHYGGHKNEKHDGSSPRDAQGHLSACWARARAALARGGVGVYGLRVCEPHHDGTPHWHMLLFCEAGRGAVLGDVLRRYFLLQHDPHEAGAEAHRVKLLALDWAKGSAVGYVIKYVCKNIDGAGMGTDQDDEAGMWGDARAEAVEAWAATWRIRQFQQIGGPGVGVWRELRKLRQCDESELLREVCAAADAGDWRGYVMGQGGPMLARKDRPLQVARTDAGQGWDAANQAPVPKENAYAEPVKPQTFGVRDCRHGKTVVSRVLAWDRRAGRLKRDKPINQHEGAYICQPGEFGPLGLVCITVREGELKPERQSVIDNAPESGAEFQPWV